jgi:hypothetical protein
VRYHSTSNKGLLFCSFEVCLASRTSYLDRLWHISICFSTLSFSSTSYDSTVIWFDAVRIIGCAVDTTKFYRIIYLLFARLPIEYIDILYTLDSASNYSAIQKLKP